MIFCKILSHDLRSGLLRKRFLILPLFLFLPLANYYLAFHNRGAQVEFLDAVIYLFQGAPKVDLQFAAVPVPISWLYLIGIFLLYHLDYIYHDLSLCGQQIIIRCHSRRMWICSKLLWNILSSCMFYLLTILCVWIFTKCMGDQTDWSISSRAISLFSLEGIEQLANIKLLFAVFLIPALTLVALNLLQMTLILFLGPLPSFLLTSATVVLSIYSMSGYILGESAMAIRNLQICIQGNSLSSRVVVPLGVIVLCAMAGSCRFFNMDILSKED